MLLCQLPRFLFYIFHNRSRLFRLGVGVGTATTALYVIKFAKIIEMDPTPPLSLTPSIPPKESGGSLTRDIAEVGGTGIAASVGVTKALTSAFSFIGFTKMGIAAKSAAAAWHSSIGNVAAGSLFAQLQSLGATGGLAVLGPVGMGAAVIAGGAIAAYKVQQSNEKQRQEEEDEERLRLENEEHEERLRREMEQAEEMERKIQYAKFYLLGLVE